MARFSKIDRRMHGDEKYRRLTAPPPCGQVLWWHLIAGRQVNIIPGLFTIGEAAFAEQLQWPLKGFREAFKEVLREGMAEADWKAHLVWIPNAIRYNPPANPNVIKSWGDAWSELPECSLKVKAWSALSDAVKGLGKGFHAAFVSVCPNPLRNPSPNQEQEQEQEQEIPPKAPKGPFDGFEEFWIQYPRKEKKPSAIKSWNKLAPSEEIRAAILADVAKRRASKDWTKDEGQFVPHPARYLNERRWEDELTTSANGLFDAEAFAKGGVQNGAH